MNRSIAHLILTLLVTIAGLGTLAGLSIGIWCLIQDSSAGILASRGIIVLAAVVLIAALGAWLLARSLTKPLSYATDFVNSLADGKKHSAPTHKAPQEISDLIDSLVKLSEKLEQEKKDFQTRCKLQSREIRTEALVRLARGISREVQNPLAGLIGFAEMALKQPQADGQLKNYLTLIDQEARAGRQSLDRILSYIQNEDFPAEPIDLNRLLVDASHSIESNEGENINLKINLTDGLPKVMGDWGQLSQVLTILIQNAKEAIGKDGDIELNSTRDQSGNIIIMIKDTGCGIAEELQDKIFTPFFTTKGNIRGAGINLALADSIVRRHGGKLEFFSKKDEGTTFFVKLPIGQKRQIS